MVNTKYYIHINILKIIWNKIIKLIAGTMFIINNESVEYIKNNFHVTIHIAEI